MSKSLNKPVTAANRRAFTIGEFCSAHRIGRTKVYAEIGAGHLQTVKIRPRKTLIDAAEADRWFASLAGTAA